MHGGFENLKHKLLPNDQESNCPLKNFCKPLKNLIEGSKQL
jgi:hypothetical protein